MHPEQSLGSFMTKVTSDFLVDETYELGRGRFGIVYKGYQLSQNRIIAVKFIHKNMLRLYPDYERELVTMRDLSNINHPNIMGYYGYEENQKGLYCFVELCKGGQLKTLIQRGISQTKVISLYKQLLEAMSYINKKNIVHRDLKPQNILLDENQDLKIADFGLAREIQEAMTKGVCSPLYSAPEILNFQQYNEKCDVWSAGIILYEMLTGKWMFSHIKRKSQLISEVERLDHIFIPDQYHSFWSQLVNRMMIRNAETRPTFTQMNKQFEKVQQKMRTDLAQKYGFETVQYEYFDSQLRLTKSVSPYQASPIETKNKLVDVAKRLKEEKSFEYLNKLRKYLHFYCLKSKMMLRLIKQFNDAEYVFMKNVHKYILMFLSVSSYVVRLQSLQLEIEKKRIRTPDGLISKEEIGQSHQGQFEEILAESFKRLDASIQHYKPILKQQIIHKILGTYMQRLPQKNIIEQSQDLTILLKNAKDDWYAEQSKYMSPYKVLIEKQGIHFGYNIIKEFNEKDVKVYMSLRLIGKLDEVLKNSNYVNDDYLRVRNQSYKNATKAENLEFIRKYN